MTSADLAGLLAGLAERDHIPGAQLALYRDGETLLAETGEERHGGGPPVSERSGFPYGSVTKSFTATVVLQLVSSGDIDLDEPIGDYIAELAFAPNGIDRLVTPRQLLSHTSGLPCDFDADTPTATSFRRYALSARALELVHRPGTAFSYSNAGFVLIGLLIEDVTGMTWWDAVESLVLQPLNIEPAFCADPRIPPRRRPIVSGHSVSTRLGRTIPVKPLCPAVDSPAGGLAGSAADLVAFGRLHLRTADESGLLAAREIELMRAGAGEVTPFGLASGWGLGLARFHTEDADWFGHDGTTDGTTCNLRFDPVRGVALAMTTNAASGLRLWDDLLAALRETGLDVGNYPAPRIPDAPVAAAPDCAGDYRNGDVCFSVVREESGLHIDLDDGIRRDLTCYEGLRFCAEAPDEHPVAGRFVRDPDTGEIESMEIGGRVARRKVGVQL
jgi:CubicO group peptidase (beta-lactamase class C family)